MVTKDYDQLLKLAKSFADSELILNDTLRVTGSEDDYEIISYYDEIVVEDSLGVQILSVPRTSED
jgi:hypothetical protein